MVATNAPVMLVGPESTVKWVSVTLTVIIINSFLQSDFFFFFFFCAAASACSNSTLLCHNGGNCTIGTDGSPQCECTTGWNGTNCEIGRSLA